jgi:hypothetical protein
MEMGKYCKAYHVKDFRNFPDWKEDVKSLLPAKKFEGGKEVVTERSSLADGDILYLQENYVVTDGIFKDDHVVFERVTDEWKRYCADVLDFRLPDHLSTGAAETQER